jgi:hypothetical protein
MKKILTIDGGGIKGVFPASFLVTIEDSIGNSVANYFDLIVGTSTGGIIALGLGLGFSAKEILAFYEKSGPAIFAGNRLLRLLRSFGFSKYSQKPLREALTSIFGERKLGESTRRLVVPSLNLETGEVHIYKTSHNPRLERDYKEPIVDVALATAAAPTYFPTHRSAAGTPLVDGGLWANNPVGLAVVEAIGVLDWPMDSLKVLSIGCTSEPLNVGLGRRFAFGLGYWGLKIVNVFMTAQSSSSLGTAQILAGHENVFRIDLPVPKGRFGLDVIKEIPSLKGLGATEARKAIPQLRPIFFNAPAEEFTPYHKLENN